MDRTTRSLLIAVGIIVVVALGLSALTGGMMGGHMMWPGAVMDPDVMQGRGWMWGLGMGLGGLVMLLFWGVLIVGTVLLVKHLGTSNAVPPGTTPLDVLKRRYAAGEITREQYEQIRKDIEGMSGA